MSARDMLDRMTQEAFFRPHWTAGMLGSPSIDMYQTDDEIVVKGSLPGVKPDDVSLTITGDALTIRGEVKE
jgi:HSP20 family protein